jgi:branched-chain amino acid transport system permease protein
MLSQFIANGLIAGSIYALVALGFALIYNTARFFHFAHGAVFTSGAYLTYVFKEVAGLPLAMAALLSIILSSLLGISIEATIYRQMRRRGASSLVLLLASLGVFIIIQNTISLIFGDETKSIREGVVQEGFNIFGARITPAQILIIVVVAVLIALTECILKLTRIGKAVRAVANDPQLAITSGINADKVILYTFAIGSVLASVAAILISLDSDMVPLMGMNAMLMGIVAVIIGGIGSIFGSAFGGLLLGLAQHLGIWQLGSQWQNTIAFVILVLFLLLCPYGFLGRPKEMRI